MRFLDVRTDYAFKKVFGSEESKPILISFLNGMIDFADGNRIIDLTIVDPYQIPLIKGMKDSYVDVKAILSSGGRVIIEMQVLNYEGLEKRILYNAAKAYSTQLMKAGEYHTLEPIIAITITDFMMFPDIQPAITYFKLCEKENLLTYGDDIELIFAELPKFTKTEAELQTITDKWLYFVKNAGSLEYVPAAMAEPELRQAFEIANTAGLSEAELEEQFRRRDFIMVQKGIERTHQRQMEKIRQELKQAQQETQQARQEGIEVTARKMKAKGLDIVVISEVTGLTREVIETL